MSVCLVKTFLAVRHLKMTFLGGFLGKVESILLFLYSATSRPRIETRNIVPAIHDRHMLDSLLFICGSPLKLGGTVCECSISSTSSLRPSLSLAL